MFKAILIISVLRLISKIVKNKIMKNVSAFVLSWSRASLSIIL